ncbi:uncharacterized protein LOC141685827 [Apium graveolens]|uniref:uncharacterized protein LOC141685827 n=1 Tax=Apium graveolens TaxID=4045 RepID=UPI003D79657B
MEAYVLSWCIIGDFNDLMLTDEKRGGRGHPRALLEGFSETVMDCGLTDLGFIGEKFSRERARGTDRWIQERLDKGLATKEWCEMFPGAQVQVLEVSTSDHLPLCLQLNRQVYVPRSRRFRFENMWIQEKECQGIIKDYWTDAGNRELSDKLLHVVFDCKSGVEVWKEHNKILRLQDENGDWKDTNEEIQQVIIRYFENIFSTRATNYQLLDRAMFPKISKQQGQELIMPLTEEEVKNVIFTMHSEKSPGVDGLNPAFFQSYWDIVGNDVTVFCQNFKYRGAAGGGKLYACVSNTKSETTKTGL